MKTNLLTPQNKTKVLSAAVVAIALATVATGTLAYFTDSTIAHNVITSGAVDIDLIEKQLIPGDNGEDTYVDYPTETIEGVMPGMQVSKIVTVQNNEQKAWVRVKVTPTITLNGQGTPNTAFIELDFNEEDWEEGDDGYWYYKKPLDEGETTEPLFTTVTFSKDMGNEYQNCTVAIQVEAEAIQHANMTAAAMQSQGWKYMEDSTPGATSEE